MSDPYLGEIRLVAFGIDIRGWSTCDGQLLPLNGNYALFALLGNRFGGDGRTNFRLPDLRGRTPLHVSTTQKLGTAGGAETVTLSLEQVPIHIHSFAVSTKDGTVSGVAGNWYAAPASSPATTDRTKLYGAPGSLVQLHPDCLKSSGGSQAHSNMQPYLALKYIIATQGIFPPRPD